jgi:LPS-assembly lipoprotein
MYRLKWIVLLVAFLSACGFHLRGVVNVAPWFDRVYIIPQVANGEFVREFKSRLQEQGKTIAKSYDTANVAVRFDKFNISNSERSNGNVRTDTLNLTVDFKVSNTKGQAITTGTSYQRGSYDYNVNNVLAASERKADILAELYSNAVSGILTQISRAKSAN